MFCTNCGKPLAETAARCDSCGATPSVSRELNPGLAASGAAASSVTEDQPTVALPPPPPPEMVSEGRVLGGRYQLDECIGSGGMGTIYRARRLHIGDTVAVKILRPEVVDNAVSRERFHREARAAAMLHHPNAVVIHDFGEDADGTTYIVMELLEGHSLRQVLQAQRTLEPDRAYEIIRQTCAAVEAAHRRGIVHRDIKPDNIVLVNSHDITDHIKILDFGIAKLRDKSSDKLGLEKSLTNVGTVIGTPYYMSPEQCQGEPADARSDIYSLGVVMYEMLTGVIPFNAKTPTGVAIKHVTEAPRPLSELRPSLAPAIERVVLRALEKDPAARQQSALEIAREFEAALKGSAQEAVPSRADAPTAEIGAASFATSVIPEASTTGDRQREFETQIGDAPIPAAAPTSVPAATPPPRPPATAAPQRRSPPVMTIGVAAILLLILSGLGWWVLSSREPSPTDAAAVIATPTPAESTQPSPPPTPATPVAPAGMVYVPGGELRMGRDEGDEYERPAHTVTVKPFFMDQTEVTNEQYQRFIDATGHPAPPAWKGTRFPADVEKLPVTDVTWEDAQAYAKWAGKRLPTEEEWEFAARGTDGRLYPWGNEFRADFANVAAAPSEKRRLAPVGQFAQGVSPFGVLDLSGNAWEWTASDYTAYPGGTLPTIPAGYENLKVIRGGSYAGPSERATATARRGWPATRGNLSLDYTQTGFRCAQDVPQP
jgi:serine/threonine protein kinase